MKIKKTLKNAGLATAIAAAIGGSYLAGRGGGGERPSMTGQFTVYKVSGENVRQIAQSPNIMVAEGIRHTLQLISKAESTSVFDTAAYLGVGNSTTTSDTSMTGLQGDSTCLQNVDSITYGADYIQYFKTFHTDDANFSWQEFVLFNDSNAICFNRATSAVGAKTTTDTFTLRLRITLD